MITNEQIRQILSIYEKFDWTLERVLLTEKLSKNLSADMKDMFRNTEKEISSINAVWFSRPSNKGGKTWELRHLSSNPFALCKTFGSSPNQEERNRLVKKMETQLKKISSTDS